MLVHCYAGQSRSVALVLAYLCSALRMQLSDAYQLVLSARPSARPNSGAPCLLPRCLQHLGTLTVCTSPSHVFSRAQLHHSTSTPRSVRGNL